MLTIEEKYNWLLSKMKLTDLDYLECDGLMQLKEPIYLQMNQYRQIPSPDKIVEDAIIWEKNNEEY